jgi:hypothetical protein
MMDTWGKLEAEQAEHPEIERLCWYLYGDGSGGLTVTRVGDDAAAAHAYGLETALALSEFLELDTRVVHDMDSAMPAIAAAVARMNG